MRRHTPSFLIALALAALAPQPLRAVPVPRAQPQASPTVIFWENGFPSAEAPPVSRAALETALPGARYATSSQLPSALADKQTRLLVLPFGSAFAESDWPAIYRYLQRGGNLLVLGGKPFTRPANSENAGWKLALPRMAYAERLLIDRYESTPGSAKLTFEPNPDYAFLNLPHFAWSRGLSPIARLSDESLYSRQGSAGEIDARLSTLVWGEVNGRRLSAPVVELDHFQKDFVGGRWIFLACVPSPGWLDSAGGRQLVSTLATRALGGAEAFLVRPEWPLFLPGEPWVFRLRWERYRAAARPIRVEIQITGAGPAETQNFVFHPGEFPFAAQFVLPPNSAPGFRVVTARLFSQDRLRAIDRTGFWLRDRAWLDSGLRVTLNHHFFAIDGRPAPIVGTTYMASDVQREFFMDPNPYVWNQDMAQIQSAGFNMIRTGWWSAWDQVMKQPGVVHEEMLRAFEAFLMTARLHNLPVQFNLFAFIPDALGGGNPYLSRDAIRRQKELVVTFAREFRRVPFLIWDLVNEPSFSNPDELWKTRPNGDPVELRAWNRWLARRYASRPALAAAWDQALVPADLPVPLPRDSQFSPQAAYATGKFLNAVPVHDYYIFSQEMFRAWAETMHEAIRAAGSRQLVTVGQDEGGGEDRLSPAWFAPAVDFTTTHSWWLNDDLLWDSLAAKQPGKPTLVQETGVQREIGLAGHPRLTSRQSARLLARKMAIAMATSAGAIQWLWNTNDYMDDDNEVAIGALRPDGSEKPEAEVLRRFARFAREAGGYFDHPSRAQVAIVTSQPFQYSALNPLAIEAQQKAVRALEYSCHIPGRMVAENQIGGLGDPKLAILPSPMALGDAAWQALLNYVRSGGNLLITGSVDRNSEWKIVDRLSPLGLAARPAHLLFHQANLAVGNESIPLSFNAEMQLAVDYLETPDDKSFEQVGLGKGRIFLADFPVELADGTASAARLYSWVLARIGIEPPFAGKVPSAGVLIRPEIFAHAVLYLFESEREEAEPIDIRDRATGAEMKFLLPPLASRLILLALPGGRVIARLPERNASAN